MIHLFFSGITNMDESFLKKNDSYHHITLHHYPPLSLVYIFTYPHMSDILSILMIIDVFLVFYASVYLGVIILVTVV